MPNYPYQAPTQAIESVVRLPDNPPVFSHAVLQETINTLTSTDAGAEIIPPQETDACIEPIPAQETGHPLFPDYTFYTNTSSEEIFALRETYPPETFQYDYDTSFLQVTRGARRIVYDTIHTYHRAQTARFLYTEILSSAPVSFRRHIRNAADITASNTGTDLNRLTDDVIQSFYNTALEWIKDYRRKKENWIRWRKEYGPVAAQYQQQCAMIRQRISPPKTINVQKLYDTLRNWENIFGLSILQHDDDLSLRIGLCDIWMNESAEESRYNPVYAIPLAPFYITFILHSNGRFSCRSEEVHGLSQEYSWYIHPHQLSDTPCFGSFNQTLINLTNEGDLLNVVSTLIAFYSQYNSRDSAGVSAVRFHPHTLQLSQQPSLQSELRDGILAHSPDAYVDTEKLEAAFERYHSACSSLPPPMILDTAEFCSHCGEVDISDENYFITVDDDRVCPDCWEDSFCGECERHHEDCICNDTEE
jgi:hypothetical protein